MLLNLKLYTEKKNQLHFQDPIPFSLQIRSKPGRGWCAFPSPSSPILTPQGSRIFPKLSSRPIGQAAFSKAWGLVKFTGTRKAFWSLFVRMCGKCLEFLKKQNDVCVCIYTYIYIYCAYICISIYIHRIYDIYIYHDVYEKWSRKNPQIITKLQNLGVTTCSLNTH